MKLQATTARTPRSQTSCACSTLARAVTSCAAAGPAPPRRSRVRVKGTCAMRQRSKHTCSLGGWAMPRLVVWRLHSAPCHAWQAAPWRGPGAASGQSTWGAFWGCLFSWVSRQLGGSRLPSWRALAAPLGDASPHGGPSVAVAFRSGSPSPAQASLLRRGRQTEGGACCCMHGHGSLQRPTHSLATWRWPHSCATWQWALLAGVAHPAARHSTGQWCCRGGPHTFGLSGGSPPYVALPPRRAGPQCSAWFTTGPLMSRCSRS